MWWVFFHSGADFSLEGQFHSLEFIISRAEEVDEFRISVNKLCVCVHALMLTRRVCVCEASVSLSLSLCARGRRFHGCFRSLYLTVLQSEGEPGGERERERGRDGEIMGMEGERRLTQSLMSFLGSLCLFLGQGPLAEDVGGLRGLWSRKEQAEPRSAQIDSCIKESSPT